MCLAWIIFMANWQTINKSCFHNPVSWFDYAKWNKI